MTPKAKRVKYREGQWFAVPLRTGGYAPGILARGSLKHKGGLGYFFAFRYDQPPDAAAVSNLVADQAILIKWFGDLGIIEGRWPLIDTDRPFRREDWPIPRFGRVHAVDPNSGWVTEYSQDDDGNQVVVVERRVPVAQIVGLPEEGTASAGYIEVKLAMLIDAFEKREPGP